MKTRIELTIGSEASRLCTKLNNNIIFTAGWIAHILQSRYVKSSDVDQLDGDLQRMQNTLNDLKIELQAAREAEVPDGTDS